MISCKIIKPKVQSFFQSAPSRKSTSHYCTQYRSYKLFIQEYLLSNYFQSFHLSLVGGEWPLVKLRSNVWPIRGRSQPFPRNRRQEKSGYRVHWRGQRVHVHFSLLHSTGMDCTALFYTGLHCTALRFTAQNCKHNIHFIMKHSYMCIEAGMFSNAVHCSTL